MNASRPRSLSQLVPAPFAPACAPLLFGAPSAAEAEDKLIPVTQLTRHLADLLVGARSLHGEGPAGALVSQWSKLYFKLMVPSALVAARVLGRPLALEWHDCVLVLRDKLPHSLWVPEDALGEPCADPARRYRSLCVGHLAPVIEALAGSVHLAPRVLWGNAANAIEFALRHALPSGENDAAYLLERREWFDTGHSNPLYRAIRYVDPPHPSLKAPFRVRRVCCIRDRLPEEPMLCNACPKLLTMSGAALDEQVRLRKERNS